MKKNYLEYLQNNVKLVPSPWRGWHVVPGEGTRGSTGKAAFTLAEVLITLGVIGVVAALTLPTVLGNIQDRVRKEQVRNIKYKLTQATDKMKSLDKIGPYATTEEFINELKNHFKIQKVCTGTNITACWPTSTILVPNTSGVFQPTAVSSITNGQNLKSLGLGTKSTATVGIITGDGTPMILTYSPKCTPLDPSTTYSWAMEDNKPVTNATTNCVSAIFDINGSKGPNKIGQDVRTLNSLFGSVQFGAQAATKADCEELKKKGLVKGCNYATDYFAGAVKKCNELGMHLPSFQTLAVAAGARYGRSDIGPYTLIMKNGYSDGTTTYASCKDYYNTHNYGNRVALADQIICTDGDIPTDSQAPVALNGAFWSSSEMSASTALERTIGSSNSSWYEYGRNDSYVPLCVGD